MSRELACGKAPKRTKGFGSQSMTSKEMIKFIIDEGTLEAKKALADISGPVSRGQLCVIFHMFRKGREEIAKGDVPAGFRLTPSPNRAAVPKAASPKRMVGSMSVPIRARGRTASYSVSRPRSASSSPNYSPNKMAKILAFTKGSERRRLLKSGLKGLRPKRIGIVKKVHGVNVYMKYPPKYANAVPVDVEYKNNGAKSNSNKSQASNYGGSNSAGSNGNRITFVNYQNLRAKRNKVVKAAPSSRFAKKMKVRKVGSRKFKKKSARPVMMKKARTQSYLQFASLKNNKTARIPTSSKMYGGSMSSRSRAQIKAASDARWKKYDAMIRQMQAERKRRRGSGSSSGSSSSNSNLSPNKKAALANRLFQEALANVNKGKIALPVMKRRSPINLASLGLGSSSNSNASAGSRSPKASLPRATARRVQERLERKLRSMARRRAPKVNIANEWERSMLKGPQGEKVSLRKTSAERALAKEFASKLVKFNSNSNKSSSSASPVKTAPKVKKSASGMKSLRKK